MAKLTGKAKAAARRAKKSNTTAPTGERMYQKSPNQLDAGIRKKLNRQRQQSASNQKKFAEVMKDPDMVKVSLEIAGPTYGLHEWAYSRKMPLQLTEKSATMRDIKSGIQDVKKHFDKASPLDCKLVGMATYIAQAASNGLLTGKCGNIQSAFGMTSELIHRHIPDDVRSIRMHITSLRNPVYGALPGMDEYITGMSENDYISLVMADGTERVITVETMAAGKNLADIQKRSINSWNDEAVAGIARAMMAEGATVH